jgi:ABC-type Mn2+/Zn2+ transport system permease subunit
MSEPWVIRALLAALLLAPLCALLGVFATARRLSFFSDTVAHAGLAGVAIGSLLGMLDPTLPLILVSLAVAAAIFWLKEHTELLTDTIMALLLSGSVAFGIVVLSLLKSRPGDIHGFLFGDILAISRSEVWQAAALAAIVMAGVFLQLSELSLITASEEMAHVCGVPVRRLNYVFILVLTMTVALSIRLLGIVLVTSLLVIPAAAARNVSRSLRQQLLLSVVFGVVGGAGGTLLAIHWNVPCGPAIVLTSIVLFIASIGFGKWRAQPLSLR